MQQPNAVPDSILQKIQKLQALAERAGTPEEAANATARIQEMLLKYNLDMQTVANHKPLERDDIIYERHDLNEFQNDHDGDFAQKLVVCLAHFNFCKVITHPTNRRQYKKDQGDFTILGQKHNVDVVMYMFDYCLNNIKTMAQDAWKVYTGTTYKNKFFRAFYDGAVLAITQRLYRQRTEAEKSAEAEQVYAIVKANDIALKEKVNQMFPALSKGRAFGSLHNSDARGMGYEAGSKMNLAKGLEGTRTTRKRLN